MQSQLLWGWSRSLWRQNSMCGFQHCYVTPREDVDKGLFTPDRTLAIDQTNYSTQAWWAGEFIGVTSRSKGDRSMCNSRAAALPGNSSQEGWCLDKCRVPGARHNLQVAPPEYLSASAVSCSHSLGQGPSEARHFLCFLVLIKLLELYESSSRRNCFNSENTAVQ